MPAPIAFPLAKLGVLLVKQISKPISRRVAKTASHSQIFRDWICIPIGQVFHNVEVRIKRASLDLPFNRAGDKQTKYKVPRLSDKQAVEQGSEIISEVLILSVAIGVIVYEFTKSQQEKREEEAVKAHERQMLREKLYNMELSVDRHQDNICCVARSMSRSCDKLMGDNSQDSCLVRNILSESEGERTKIEPLQFSEEESTKTTRKTRDKDNEDKSLSDEIVEFVEEVVEEVLEVVNPDDDD